METTSIFATIFTTISEVMSAVEPICSKSSFVTSSGVFIVNFEHILNFL